MPRPKFTVSAVNIYGVRQYIERQMALNPYWPVEDADYEAARTAYTGMDRANPEDLQHWQERWLTPRQRERMLVALRAQKKRQRNATGSNDPNKNITLTRDAWRILSDLAKRDRVTISQFIINRLEKEWLAS